MRVVVYGAGAVGGTIGARLHEAGHDVVLIARGAHHDAIAAGGLRYRDPESVRTLAIPVVDDPGRIDWSPGDVVILAVKGQHTPEVLARLDEVAPSEVPVVCAQNGVDNERVALRLRPNVIGMCVMMPATHLEPGEVDAESHPIVGVLDVGRYPHGVDEVTEELAAALDGSGFRSAPDPAIMRWKYEKLLLNLATAMRAICGPESDDDEAAAAVRARLTAALRSEALACYERAGIDRPTEQERRQRWDGALTAKPIEGRERVAGSAWQSLSRGVGSVESDVTNGEIVLLGRLHGIDTPANEVVRRRSGELARARRPPGSVPVVALAAEIGLDAPPRQATGHRDSRRDG